MGTVEKKLFWENILEALKGKCSPSEFKTWIQPLQPARRGDAWVLFAPNDFVVDWVKRNFLEYIHLVARDFTDDQSLCIVVEKGSREREAALPNSTEEKVVYEKRSRDSGHSRYGSPLNPAFSLNTFVKGKSNEFAFAAASQVAACLSGGYNPLLIYGGVGLGKTHLMHAIGNAVLNKNPNFKVLYLHSERFVANMVKALQTNQIEAFQNYHRSADFLLIDDIQFLAGKDRSQEEFFHTFNSLIEDRKQIILTCDRYPKEIGGLKERLQSRFGWGLTVAIEPPELETRVAILLSKAEYAHVHLPQDAAFFIAKRMHSNVRELEGALKRVVANSDFTGKPITLGLVKEVLKDLITLQDKMVTIENIQRSVAEYYKIRVSDLLSKRRCRSITRPRQMAMALSKELTDRSFPEIGRAFSGKDHTTVLYACRKIKELIKKDTGIKEDYSNLLRILTA